MASAPDSLANATPDPSGQETSDPSFPPEPDKRQANNDRIHNPRVVLDCMTEFAKENPNMGADDPAILKGLRDLKAAQPAELQDWEVPSLVTGGSLSCNWKTAAIRSGEPIAKHKKAAKAL